MNRRTGPLLAGAAAALVVGLAAADVVPPSGGGVLSDGDRAALAALPVRRGPDPPPADPAVDPTDPEAVARAYLGAAHSITAQDAGGTQLRAAAYAAPGSPAALVGVLVLDPPAAGAVRTATVTALELVAADRGDRRRGYRAELGTATGPPGGPAAVDLAGRDVVVARQPDGRWLVAADTTSTADLSSGED